MDLLVLSLWIIAAVGMALSIAAKTRLQRALASPLLLIPLLAWLFFPTQTSGLEGIIWAFLGVNLGILCVDFRNRSRNQEAGHTA